MVRPEALHGTAPGEAPTGGAGVADAVRGWQGRGRVLTLLRQNGHPDLRPPLLSAEHLTLKVWHSTRVHGVPMDADATGLIVPSPLPRAHAQRATS